MTATGGTGLTALPPPPPPPPPGPRRPVDRPGPARPARRRSAWVVLGSVLAVVLLVGGAYQVVSVLAHEERTTVTVHDDRSLRVVDVDAVGSVRVVGTDRGAVTVRARISDGLRATRESQRISGDRLVVSSSCPVVGSTWCDVDYVLRVPSGVEVRVRAEGSIRLTGVAGPVTARSVAGSVRAEDIGGPADLSAVGGDVRAAGVRAEVIGARSTGGSVEVDLAVVPRSVVATTVGGSVDVAVPRSDDAYRIDAEAVGGGRSDLVRSDPAGERTITARSVGGDVVVRYRD